MAEVIYDAQGNIVSAGGTSEDPREGPAPSRPNVDGVPIKDVPRPHFGPMSPPQSHTEEMIQALEAHGDQAQSAEREIAPGLTLTIGIRNVYLNNDGDVVALARTRVG